MHLPTLKKLYTVTAQYHAISALYGKQIYMRLHDHHMISCDIQY